MTSFSKTCLVLSALALVGCGPNGNTNSNLNINVNINGNGNTNDNSFANDNENSPAVNPKFSEINDFLYQLQDEPELDLEAIGATAFDLVIMDYSRDGSEEGEFGADEIQALKDSPGGTKIVLAYISIGEAEIGRFYFDNSWITPNPDTSPDEPFELTGQAPEFLAPPNPDWPDNFKVRYWLELWQQIIISNPGNHPIIGDNLSYLDRIIDAGFDGIYMDIIDAYEFFGPDEIEGNDENRHSAANMISFVMAIADHARYERGLSEFIIVPQNGAAIIDESSYVADALQLGTDVEEEAELQEVLYFAAIDAIGVEDTLYFGDKDEDNPFAPDEDRNVIIDLYRQQGNLVLATDYLTQDNTIDDFYDRARDLNWIPYATVRALDQININPTQPPD